MPMPEGIVSVLIDRETGCPARAGQRNVVFEVFREGKCPNAKHSKTLPDIFNNASDSIDEPEAEQDEERNPLLSDGTATQQRNTNATRAGSSRRRPHASLSTTACAITGWRSKKPQSASASLAAGRLPGNAEIEAAVAEHLQLFGGDSHADHLRLMRVAALSAMELLAAFTPRLVGPVLVGTADENSAVNLHVFADSPDSRDGARRYGHQLPAV